MKAKTRKIKRPRCFNSYLAYKANMQYWHDSMLELKNLKEKIEAIEEELKPKAKAQQIRKSVLPNLAEQRR